MPKLLFVVAASLSLWSLSQMASAVDQGLTYKTEGGEPLLQPYEPITGSYTKDSDDVPYLDVTLSLKIRLLPTGLPTPQSRLFVAMTTRFGFYWGTRGGSPVIGKSYNPKLIWRYVPDEKGNGNATGHSTCREEKDQGAASCKTLYARDEYLDFAYAHESNGQPIHTQAQYLATLPTVQEPQYANDYIHRGWDYLEVVWKQTYEPPWEKISDPQRRLAAFLDVKYFLPNGLLQGPEDQYHAWEGNPQGKPRKAVDGITGVVEYPISLVAFSHNTEAWLSRLNGVLKYQTGYQGPFRYSTLRAEAGFQLGVLPLAVWAQRGYMSDLAMYSVNVTSYGLELRIGAF